MNSEEIPTLRLPVSGRRFISNKFGNGHIAKKLKKRARTEFPKMCPANPKVSASSQGIRGYISVTATLECMYFKF
jgi:hypothetical protein